MTTRAEQETIIRWDEEEHIAFLYTANPAQARRWRRLGYPVKVFDRRENGDETGWEATGPVEAVRFRRLENGKVKKRKWHGKGRLFGHDQEGQKHDQLVASDDHPEAG